MAWHFWQYIYMYQYYSCGGLSIDVVSVLTEEWDQRRTTSSFSSPTFHLRCWRPACQESLRLPWSSQGWMWPAIPSQSSPQYTTTWEEHPPTTKDRSVVNITKKSLISVVAHCLQVFWYPLPTYWHPQQNIIIHNLYSWIIQVNSWNCFPTTCIKRAIYIN